MDCWVEQVRDNAEECELLSLIKTKEFQAKTKKNVEADSKKTANKIV